MFCLTPFEVNYLSIIIFIDKNIVRLRITLYYLNIVKFFDGIFDLVCLFLFSRECDGVNIN